MVGSGFKQPDWARGQRRRLLGVRGHSIAWGWVCAAGFSRGRGRGLRGGSGAGWGADAERAGGLVNRLAQGAAHVTGNAIESLLEQAPALLGGLLQLLELLVLGLVLLLELGEVCFHAGLGFVGAFGEALRQLVNLLTELADAVLAEAGA